MVACRSVGKPGYSCVRTDTACGKCNPCRRLMELSPISNLIPARASNESRAAECLGSQSTIFTSCPASAANIRKLPVSILSGGVIYGLPFARKMPPPSIFSVGVPAPSICAPQVFKYPASESISGSIAAFSKIVLPSARVAASISVSVAVTETNGKKICAPSNSRIRRTSSISGTFLNSTSSSNSIDAARALRIAFFAPRTAIVPERAFFLPNPSITNLLLFMLFGIYFPPEFFGKILCVVAYALTVVEILCRYSLQNASRARHRQGRNFVPFTRRVEPFHEIFHQLAALGYLFSLGARRKLFHVFFDVLHALSI